MPRIRKRALLTLNSARRKRKKAQQRKQNGGSATSPVAKRKHVCDSLDESSQPANRKRKWHEAGPEEQTCSPSEHELSSWTESGSSPVAKTKQECHSDSLDESSEAATRKRKWDEANTPEQTDQLSMSHHEFSGECHPKRARHSYDAATKHQMKLNRDRDGTASRRSCESLNDGQQRLFQDRLSKAKQRAGEPIPKREKRLALVRVRACQRRADESPSQTEVRHASDRRGHHERIEHELPQEKQDRLSFQQSGREACSQQARERDTDILANTDHSQVLLRPASVQQQYATALESLREHDAFAATVAFYAASGHGRGPAPTREDVDVQHHLDSCIPEPVSATTLDGAIRRFRDQYDVSCINACAACGKRDIDTFTRLSLRSNQAQILRLDDQRADAFKARPEEEQRLCNIFRSADGHHYHLVPDLVDDVGDNEMVNLCSKCAKATSSGNVPKFSLAKGVDFGRTTNLPELSLLEKVVISPYRCFVTILKLKSPCGTNRLASQNCLRGHAVMFPHDGPERLVTQMPRHALADVARDISIVFLGSRQQFKKKESEVLDPKGPHAQLLRCNGENVMKWLKAMRRFNHPAYQHLNAASWDLSEKAMAALEQLPTLLVCNAHCASGRLEAELEEAVIDDTAHARPSGDLDSLDSSAAPAIDGIHSVLLTPRDTPLQRQPAAASIAIGVARLTGTTIETTVQDEPLGKSEPTSHSTSSANIKPAVHTEPVIIRTDDREPVNEFTGNVILNGFPYLFLHGTGAPRGPDDSSTRRLLLWHDNRFAIDQRFVFYLYNMKQRWAAAQGVSAKVKSDRSAIESFNELISEQNFESRLQNAVHHPMSPDARRLMSCVQPLLSASGQRVPFGPAERSSTIARMCALVHFAGLPLWFWTISPSDVDNLLALRIAGVQFPPMPGLQARAQAIAHNPVAAARAFHELINSLLTNFFGLASESSHQRKSASPFSSDVRRSQPCVMCGQQCTAFYGVTETQGRGALHMHGLLFCTVGPHLLQRCQANKQLASKLAALIDSVIVAQLPADVHAARIERLRRGEPAERVGLRSGTGDAPLPCADDDGLAFAQWRDTIIATTNVHTHSATCKKGRVGDTKCRLSFPRGVKDDGTGPVLLENVWRGDEEKYGYDVMRCFDDIPPTTRKVDFSMSPVPLPERHNSRLGAGATRQGRQHR